MASRTINDCTGDERQINLGDMHKNACVRAEHG